ncbi:hypothetical protein DB31_1075 [Hyalangium minutum]|uniref:Uncharacterized protein n=1 Tax=Hyalangium minutum TaxID=394096 RepID=A0A085WFY9_9BACT|nr:hypothetical protein DB31_1075 [Hyalangium minutum]
MHGAVPYREAPTCESSPAGRSPPYRTIEEGDTCPLTPRAR